MTEYDAVLRGGRVIDPESGLDAVRDVAVAGDRVAAVGTGLPPGRQDADVAGLVVTAGFVDLHSHAHDLGSARLRATDGVTTALELEAGVTPVAAAYAVAAAAGRPVNYGFAASWAMARMDVLAGVTFDGSIGPLFANLGNPRWGRAASRPEIDRILGILESDVADGALGIGLLVGYAPAATPQVSTEAYPYGAGMTGIGASFLAPERLAERGLTPRSISYAPTGEQVSTAARLNELRAADPGGLAIIRQLDEDDPADRAVLLRYLTFPGSVIASDAMPLTWIGAAPEPAAWPLPPAALAHPRTAGTYARSISTLRRNGGLSLSEILAKCSLRPAALLQDRVPAMRRKGRISEGSDADIVVFDPETITDQATYSDSTRPSTGIRHVLVNGTFVVRDGKLDTSVQPGRPVRA